MIDEQKFSNSENWCDIASKVLLDQCIYCAETKVGNKDSCQSIDEKSGFICTREKDHEGKHYGCCGHEGLPSYSWK